MSRIEKNKTYLQELKEGKTVYGNESKVYKWNNDTNTIDMYMYADADCLIDTKTSIDENTFLNTF